MRGQDTRKAPRRSSADSRANQRKNVRWARQPVKKRARLRIF